MFDESHQKPIMNSSDKVYPHPQHPEILIAKFGQLSDLRSHLPVVDQRWRETAQPNLIVIDLSCVSADCFELYSRGMGADVRGWQVLLPDDDWKLFFVCPKNEDRESRGLVTQEHLRFFEGFVVESIEEATEKLLPYRKPLLVDTEQNLASFADLFQHRNLVFVGSEESDTCQLPVRFKNAGVYVRHHSLAEDGDDVVFCVSALNGPMEKTRSAVTALKGKTIRPLAIVRTNILEFDYDPELHELIVMEMRELISRLLPEQIINALPRFEEFDPGLVCKIAKLMKEDRDPIVCRTYQTNAVEQESKGLSQATQDVPARNDLRPDPTPEFESSSTGPVRKELQRLIPLLEDEVQRKQMHFGRDHEVTLSAVANLGQHYREYHRFIDAVQLLEEAYRASDKYPSLHWAGAELLQGYVRAEDKESASKLAKQLVDEVREHYPNASELLANQLAIIGQEMLNLEAFEEAEQILRECLAIRKRLCADSWLRFNAESALGGALLGQRMYDKAERLLVSGFRGMMERENTINLFAKFRIMLALTRLVKLYEGRNQIEPSKGFDNMAAKWQQELSEFQVRFSE